MRSETGVNVLAIRRADDRQLFTEFGPDFSLQIGDTLIGLGTAAQLTALARHADDERHVLHPWRQFQA